jgi:hypothetical protein
VAIAQTIKILLVTTDISVKNNTHNEDHHTDKDLIGFACLWLAIAVMVLVTLPQSAGDFIASPFERHRHSNNAIWLLWMSLRILIPIAICIIPLLWLFMHGG